MGLVTYIIRRMLLMLPTILGVCLLIFAVVQLLPINKRAMLFIQDVRELKAIPEIIKEYGLDQPVYVQFATWMGQVLQGNLGWSEIAYEPVLPAILKRLPATAEIVIFCTPIIILVGIFLGTLSAVHRDKPIDHISRSLSIMGTSLPSFWIGLVLLSIFYYGLGWFAPFRYGNAVDSYITAPYSPWRWYTGFVTIDSLLNGQPWIFVDALRHLVLPVIVLTLIQTALIVRVMRSSMLESLGKGYITAAMAKGLTQKEVVNKHARRNALIPVVTISGLLVAGMLTGLIITETVFNFPGIGKFAAQAAFRLDVATVLGYALLSAIVFVIANLIVDIMYAWIDPRIRLE